MRSLREETRDPEGKRMMLKLADNYDKLAKRAEDRLAATAENRRRSTHPRERRSIRAGVLDHPSSPDWTALCAAKGIAYCASGLE